MAAAAASLVHPSSVAAQPSGQAAKVGIVEDPCGALPPQPREITDFIQATEMAHAAGQPPPVQSAAATAANDEWQNQLRLADFFNLCRYRAANQMLPPPSSTRIVFMGDSITEGWKERRPEFFRGDRVDRGISGQTTSQMVGRFYADVIALHPAIVHILAGTNDIAGNGGPTSLDAIENNLRSMVELAQAHHIRVILGTVLPATRYSWRPTIDPVPSIHALNAWIRRYAQARGVTVVDYYSILDDGRHGLAQADSDDGVHPSAAGYARMEKALGARLGRGRP
jgi:acyl-CoA thioesterase-1